MKRSLFVVALMAAFCIAASAQGIAVGGTVENFSLSNLDGKTVSLNDMKGKNGAVIVFVSSQCPVVKLYNERMNQIAADYAAKGIAFIGINSNATEMDKAAAKPLEWVRTHINETYKFPVLFDKGNVLADKLGASVTPEAFYVLLYHGAIDNDRSGETITESYLRTAFDSSLAGKKIERVKANAFGCTIKRAAPADTK
jgi:thiol-disulfide isomerase/thioredoxin